jgi:aspartate/methionine/tyrosine aminotransferase
MKSTRYQYGRIAYYVDRNIPYNAFKFLLSRDTTDLINPDLVHVLWGMSKDFGANGLRVGAIISQSNVDFHVAQKCLSLSSFVPSMSGQITTSIVLDDDFTDKYVKMNQKKLSECHEFLTQLLDRHKINYLHGCNAGFFIWVNLGKKYLEVHPEKSGQGTELTDILFQKLLDHKVYVAHRTAYGSETWAGFVWCFHILVLG